MSESPEAFSSPGIDPEAYIVIKENEDPFYHTPIDELIVRCKREGIRVILTSDPNSGNILILPSQSDDILNDSLFPRHLHIVDGMNEQLKALILLQQELKAPQELK